MMLLVLLALTVPEVWQAGRQMDTLRLRTVHQEAWQQFHREGTAHSRLLVALADLYRVQAALATRRPEAARSALQEALRLLEAVPETQRTADLWAFLGNFYGTALALAPWYRRPGLGRRASEALHRAVQQDSLNPRVWLFLGIQAFYTPRLFGGGAEKALQRLDRALALYRQLSVDPFWHRWGEDLALFYRARALMRLGHEADARQALNTCLQRYPDFQEARAWLRRLQEVSSNPQKEVKP